MDLDGVPERITSRLTERPTGCWTWSGAHNRAGYSCVWWDGSQRGLHRVLYQLLRGPVPEGLVLDHVVCNDKTCPNPWHVEPETNVRNMLRSENAPATINQRRERCANGHDDWTTRPDGRRRCRQCARDEARRRQRRKRGIPDDHPLGKHFNRRGGGGARVDP